MEKSCIDRFGAIQSPYIDNQIDQGIEIGNGVVIMHLWSFDAKFFGLTIDAFAARALVGESVIERMRAIHKQTNAASRFISLQS